MQNEHEPNTEWEANITLAKNVPSWQDEAPKRERILKNEKRSNVALWAIVALVAAVTVCIFMQVAGN